MALGLAWLGLEYFPEFLRGRSLFNAYLYFGEIDTDPTQPINQKTITLRHSGGDTVVAQPVRTGAGGVADYQGSPAQILIDGDYSITVQDHAGTEVYHIAQLTALGLPGGGGGDPGDCCDRWGSTTVTVGATGDYATLDLALSALSNTGKKHDPGTSVIVQFQTAEAISGVITIAGTDLSWIEIQSVDPTVSVSAAGLSGGAGFFNVIDGGDSPIINTVFTSDVSGAGGYSGMYVSGAGSTANIMDTAGFKSFAIGLNVIDGGIASVPDANFNGSSGSALRAANGGHIDANSTIVTNCGGQAVLAEDGGYIDATSVAAADAVGSGFVVADGGVINATGGTGTFSQAANILYQEGIIYHDSGPIYMPVVYHATAAAADTASQNDGGIALHVAPDA